MPVDCELFWRVYVGRFGDAPIPFLDSFDSACYTGDLLSDLLEDLFCTFEGHSVFVELGRVFDTSSGSDDLLVLWSGVLIEASFFLASPPAVSIE